MGIVLPFHAHLGCTVRTKILSMWIYIYTVNLSIYQSIYLHIYTHINQFTLQIMLPKVIHEIKKGDACAYGCGCVCVCVSQCLPCRNWAVWFAALPLLLNGVDPHQFHFARPVISKLSLYKILEGCDWNHLVTSWWGPKHIQHDKWEMWEHTWRTIPLSNCLIDWWVWAI